MCAASLCNWLKFRCTSNLYLPTDLRQVVLFFLCIHFNYVMTLAFCLLWNQEVLSRPWASTALAVHCQEQAEDTPSPQATTALPNSVQQVGLENLQWCHVMLPRLWVKTLQNRVTLQSTTRTEHSPPACRTQHVCCTLQAQGMCLLTAVLQR